MDYTLCSGTTEAGMPCPFFVEENDGYDTDPRIAKFIHLTRGDDEDDELDDHEATPGERHSLAWWQENGPERVRNRFVVEA